MLRGPGGPSPPAPSPRTNHRGEGWLPSHLCDFFGVTFFHDVALHLVAWSHFTAFDGEALLEDRVTLYHLEAGEGLVDFVDLFLDLFAHNIVSRYLIVAHFFEIRNV